VFCTGYARDGVFVQVILGTVFLQVILGMVSYTRDSVWCFLYNILRQMSSVLWGVPWTSLLSSGVNSSSLSSCDVDDLKNF